MVAAVYACVVPKNKYKIAGLCYSLGYLMPMCLSYGHRISHRSSHLLYIALLSYVRICLHGTWFPIALLRYTRAGHGHLIYSYSLPGWILPWYTYRFPSRAGFGHLIHTCSLPGLDLAILYIHVPFQGWIWPSYTYMFPYRARYGHLIIHILFQGRYWHSKLACILLGSGYT